MRKRPEIPALISVAFFFGSNSVAGRLVLAHLTPSVLLIARVVGAALVFAALYWARGFRRIVRAATPPRWCSAPSSAWR